MNRTPFFVAVLLALGVATAGVASGPSGAAPEAPAGPRIAAPPDSLGAIPGFDVPDTVEVEAHRAPWGRYRFSLLYDEVHPAPGRFAGSRPSPARPLLPARPVLQPNTFQRMVFGADQGANAALMVGGLGNWFGWWDEKTAYSLMGAGAAVGAILGGAKPPAGR